MGLDIDDVIEGKYRIVRLLGEGGMGAVYEGLNVRIHRKVAIKVLHGNVAKSADAVQRFEREAQAAGRIGSKHIVEVLDLGDLPGGDRYMVMEFLEGESFADRIRRLGQLSPQELYPIAVQLLDGLAAAHAAGIVHRDLKPDNVFLVPAQQEGQADFVKILDFGISKFNTLGGEFSMTRTGAVMGTPYYMSPEQAKGARELDQRTDLYAVGVILYEALSGRVPFHAETFNELLFKIVLEEAPPLESLLPGVNPAFVQIVSKAMARDAAQRYQTASDFKAALSLWSERGSVAPLGIVEPVPTYGTSLPTKTVAQGSTAGAWTQTGLSASSGKSQTLLYAGIAVAAALAVGGGIALALRSNADAERAEGAEQEEPLVAAERSTPEELAALKKTEPEPPTEKVEEPSAPLEQKDDAPPAETTSTTPSSTGKKTTAASTTKKVTTPANPPPTEKKPETPAPSTGSQNSGSSTSTGRPIRTTL